MSLAIFDLDDTLLRGSSDAAWEQFLVERGLLDAAECDYMHERFSMLYHEGMLNIYERQRYFLKSLKHKPIDKLRELREDFLAIHAHELLLDKAKKLLETHRQHGHSLIIISASNHFITEPFARIYDVDHLIATEAEIIDDEFTGEILGIPSFRDGKIKRLEMWLNETGQQFDSLYYYGDSCNDIPLLNYVDQPIAVDPDDILRHEAFAKSWKIISLR